MSAAVVEKVLFGRLGESARPWLEAALAAGDEGKLLVAFAVAPRKLGSDAVIATADELALAGRPSWMSSTSIDELGRIALLVKAAELSADPAALAAEWYRQGDNAEKRAVLRALSLFPAPARCVEVGINACRSSVQSVFEGICCENPYPAACFPELAFNQMVLKALFTGVALERVQGLDARKNAELARMAAGYASERRAAGRSVPTDIGRVL